MKGSFASIHRLALLDLFPGALQVGLQEPERFGVDVTVLQVRP